MSSDKIVTSWNKPIKDAAQALGSIDPKNNNWLKPIFGSEKNDVVLHRDATFLSRNARVDAYKNVRGGSDVTFDKTNLYGFSIFQFSNTFGNGWNRSNIGSLLGSRTVGTLTGGDSIANIGSYFFNVNPRSISLGEAFTTNITPTQNSGFYIESQGIQLRPMSISGTTGYRPNIEFLAKRSDGTSPVTAEEPTGFVNFIKLRNLFRNYSDLKKDPKQSYNTYLVWYNGRTQEAWFCEPTNFEASRSSGSPFTTNYNISVVLLRKMAFSAVSSSLNPYSFDKNFLLETMRLGGLALQRENLPEWLKPIGAIVNETTETLTTLASLTQTANDLMYQAVLGIPGAATGAFLYTAADVVAKSSTLAFSISTALKNLTTATTSITGVPNDIKDAYVEFGVDLQTLAISVGRAFAAAVRIAAKEAPSAGAVLADRNSKYGRPGAANSKLPSNTNIFWYPKIVPTNIPSNVFKWLQQEGVTEDMFEIFAIMNGLEFPWTSNVPGPSLATPGDELLIPIPAKSIPNDIGTILLPFNLQNALLEEVLGRDLKLSKLEYEQGFEGFVFDLTDTGDIALVEGRENLIQAIYIKLNVPKGDLPLHPSFGKVDVVGVKATRNLLFASYLAYNDTMLSDGRVESLSDIDIKISGDIMEVSFVAHVIGGIPSIPVGLSLGV